MSTLSSRREPIHPWRWRLLAIWIVVFSGFVIWSITHIKNDSATVAELQHTNCGLALTMLQARKTRWSTYEKSHSHTDLSAVLSYETLVSPFLDKKHRSIGRCDIKPKLLIKDRPLDDLTPEPRN